ncbi:hypothetical protein BRC93_15370 [Halobacteriales archaeon QS_5_70_15]|nr:MAG: hypothetical protein BRC93_15370 [Halobacteriales archaeon QS_5_70_15]
MTLRLLHYSDVENAYDDPERVGRLAGTLLAGDGGDALACGTGDNTAPGVLALRTEGWQSLDLFAAVEPDSETFGNHDLDLCAERTLELVPRSPQQWLRGTSTRPTPRRGRTRSARASACGPGRSSRPTAPAWGCSG